MKINKYAIKFAIVLAIAVCVIFFITSKICTETLLCLVILLLFSIPMLLIPEVVVQNIPYIVNIAIFFFIYTIIGYIIGLLIYKIREIKK